MCIYYQAIGQLIGSLLMEHQIIAIIITSITYAIFTLFNGVYVRLHRTTHPFFDEISQIIGFVYATCGVHYAIFVFDRCQGEGEFSEVTIDFNIEVDKMNFYVLRILVNVLIVKALTFLVLYIKFNDWKRKISDASVDNKVIFLKPETEPSIDVKVQCNSKIVSKKAEQLKGKIVIAWQNLTLFGNKSIYDFSVNKNKSNQPILQNLNGKLCFGTLNALMGTSGAVSLPIFVSY